MIYAFLAGLAVGALAVLFFTGLHKQGHGFTIIDDKHIEIKGVKVKTPNGVKAQDIDSAAIAEGGQIEITIKDGATDRRDSGGDADADMGI